MFYNNVQRSQMRAEFPDLKLTDISKSVAEKWHKLTDVEKAPYNRKSNKDKRRYEAAKKVFLAERSQYEKFMAELYPNEPIPWIKTKKGKKGKRAKKIKEKKIKGPSNLVNKVVRVEFPNQREMPGWKYYFVLTYIPDLQWCRLAPMFSRGTFANEKNGISIGRFRWKLVEEGKALEVDVSAKRCTVVKTRVMKHTPNADEEEWDILDDRHYPASEQFDLSGNVYKSVAKTLLSPLLLKFKNVTVNSSPHVASSSSMDVTMDIDDDDDDDEDEDDEDEDDDDDEDEDDEDEDDDDDDEEENVLHVVGKGKKRKETKPRALSGKGKKKKSRIK